MTTPDRPTAGIARSSPGSLAALLAGIARGVFPAPDGSVTVLPQPSPRDAGVFGFTAHAVIFAEVDPAWVAKRLAPGDLAAPLRPEFLASLAARLGRRVNSVDMLSVTAPLPGPPPIPLSPVTGRGHPRVARARRFRDRVQAWQADGGGVVILGAGVARRWEVAVEVEPGARGKGLGRKLAAAARHLVPPGEALWAQVAPGNAASVRAFMAAGYVPVGAEALLTNAGP